MDPRKEKPRKPAKAKTMKRKEKKPRSGMFTRRKKSLRSFSQFMSRILKTLSTLAHFGEGRPPEPEDDDDGGFGRSDSGGFREEPPVSVPKESAVKKSSTLSSHGSVKERLSWCYGDKTPGALGLKNHGNTCFMNAVVQCLSNTDLLAEYLGLEHYKPDVLARRVNSETAKGEVTEQLASLVRALWTLEYTPQLSVDFKSIVAKYGSQFRGNSQHDALEFLLWLLDRVHEDAKNPNSNNSSSSSSNNAKANFKGPSSLEDLTSKQPRGRNSFVQEHFQAQYRSSLTCPHCLKQSNTFDPFLCISLPIPLRQTRPICVTLVLSTKGQRYLRVGLAVPLFGSLSILRAMVAEEGAVSPEQIILAEVYSTGFQRSFTDDDDLTAISDSDVIYAFQAPPLHGRAGSVSHSGYHHSLPNSPHSSSAGKLPSSGTLSTEYLNQGSVSKVLLLICNTSGCGQQAVRFGPPFLILEDKSISWEQLQQNLLNKLYYLMLNRSHAQNTRVLFKIRVVGVSASPSYLSPQDSRPLHHSAVNRALKICGPGGPQHVKVVIEWEQKLKDCLFGSIQEEVVQDAESVRNQQQQHLQQHNCTLDQCFQLYTKEEQLAPDDAWKCPHCKQMQQGMVKMSLWTLPDILILHLKRFRQVGERRNKLSTLVHFPLTALDMAPHVVKRSHSMRNLNSGPWPTSRPKSAGQQHPPVDMIFPHDYLYDLYAVCNHHGGMHGGHYTAYCRNSVDGVWYSYDDSSVDLVPEEEVCTKGAYILFYQRRNIIPPWSASSSLRGSTSSSVSDHWLIRLTGDSKRGSMVSRSSTTCPSSVPDSPDSPVFLEKEEGGGCENRPFVRGLQGRSVSMRAPNKTKDTLNKVLPLRWSLGSRERRKPEPELPDVQVPAPVELVQYLESGRRPRCTKDPIESLMSEPRNSKAASGSRAVRSSSAGRISSVAKVGDESRQVPQGQRRPSEQTSSLRSNKETQPGEEGTSNSLARSKDSKRRSSPKKQQDTKQVCDSGVQSSSSILGGTLRKQKDNRTDREHCIGNEGAVKGKKEGEGLLSLFKGNFLWRDKDSRRSREGTAQDGGRRTPSRVSLSNGAAGGEPRNSHFEELANGKARRSSTDIKRSQSSSSLPARMEQSTRRTASLHRNGMPAPSTQNRAANTDKSYASLPRPRFGTASLGRKRNVQESSF
ncbi:ubiquitin carboxyl-terminal hydrolase 43a isoform X2 [Stigmatopora nigra]